MENRTFDVEIKKERKYNKIEEALEALRQGKIILVTDDEDRENEGDLICAAEFATQENINFIASKRTYLYTYESENGKQIAVSIDGNKQHG